jgi:hypothetical protein
VNGTAERLRRLPAAIVWVAALVDLALVVIVLANVAIPPIYVPALVTMPTSLGFVGALLATRRPRNPIGWIFWSAGLIVSFTLAYTEAWSETTVLVAWVGNAIFLPTIAAVVLFVPLLFPTGGLPARSWRPPAAFMVFGLATLVLQNMFSPGPLGDTTIENPFGIPALRPVLDALRAASSVIVVICFGIAIVAPVWRYRRGGPVERQQLKWFAATTAVAAITLPLSAFHIPVVSDLAWPGGLLALGLMPLAIGIAILRYRLYEIDRIISRTISYGVVTALLVAVFAIVVVGLQAILTPFTSGQGLPVAASTLVVFALFQPLRRRVQIAIDRRFDRARYDGDRTIAEFAGRLRDEVDLARLRGELRAVVGSSLAPISVGVWLRPAEQNPRR